MADPPKPKPKPFKLESSEPIPLERNEDGSMRANAAGKAVHLDIEAIKSVGVQNLVDVEEHTINRVFGSVSHFIRFFGGGEIRFSYNANGEILEFSASNVGFEILDGDRIILKRSLPG